MKNSMVSLTRCFYCLEPGDILLCTRFRGDGEPARDMGKYHDKVVNMTPCAKCAELMKKGVILIGIDAEKSDPDWNKPDPEQGKHWMPNPYRSGEFLVVTDDAVRRLFPESLAEWAVKHRWIFCEGRALHSLMPKGVDCEPTAECSGS